MIKYCRETPEIAENNADAILRLSNFVIEFESLQGSSINDVHEWEAIVNKHASPGWEAKVHFDHLLENFGFEKEASDIIRKKMFTKPDGDEVSFEQHALRWLGKALGAYGPEGALTDVVNVVFAMTGEDPTDLSDIEIAAKIDAFNEKIVTKDTADLWVPTHFFMDAEVDDCLVWVLLLHVLETSGQPLNVLVQLPADDEFDEVADRWRDIPDCQVWRDPGSRNAKAVRTLHLKK